MKLLKHLWLAAALILATSAVLLITDMDRREGTGKQKDKAYPDIAVMQIASTPLLDSHVAGILSYLKEARQIAPDGRNLHLFNPQGDFSTANAVAREMVKGDYDLVITSSTVALQVVAKANQSSKKPHVFGAVTDPYGAGVGITGPNAKDHPPYLAGIGTFQPVENVFRLAKTMNSSLSRVGVVWNSGEQCSEACLIKARAVCAELGIILVEATATNPCEVQEALRSVLSKGVHAIWIGGDTVAIASAEMIVRLAKQDGIPVFSNDPTDTDKGALFGLGADYFTVGRYTGEIAAAILNGRSPSDFPISNMMPEQLSVNVKQLEERFFKNWRLTSAIKSRLETQKKSQVRTLRPALHWKSTAVSKVLELRLVMYSDTQFAEECRDGLLDGLKKGGLVEGRDFNVRVYNAQADMSTLSSIMTAIKSRRPDLLMVISTPSLQAALRLAGKETKIVFTGVGDGVRAGAGTSETDHLPNVTGITTRSPFRRMARTIHETLPGVKAVGTLFTPAEINSVLYKDWFAKALKDYGIRLEAVPVTSSPETSQASDILCRKQIQAVAQIVDNTTRPGFAQIARRARNNGLPVYVFDSSQMKDGGVICLARDYYDAGLEGAEKALRVLSGENPGTIPFNNTQSEKVLLNADLAEQYKLTITPELKEKAIPFSLPVKP